MTSVTVQPGDYQIEVEPNETLADAAWRQGFHWPSTCWGKGECMACAVEVRSDVSETVPADQEELKNISDRLPYYLQKKSTRLACRLKFLPDVAVAVIEKNNVRPPSSNDKTG